MAAGGSEYGAAASCRYKEKNDEEGQQHYEGACHPGNMSQLNDVESGHRGGARGRPGGRGRGGRGRGRGYRGRRYRDGEKRPNGFGPNASRHDDEIYIGPTLDMTPVGNIAKVNVYWESCEKKRAARPEPPPFKFEKPETDFHLQVAQEMRELREERKLLTDRWGRPISDCRSNHSFTEMCQFCDGDRGPWASKNPKPDKAFLRYQNSILASIPNQMYEAAAAAATATDESSGSGRRHYADNVDSNPLKLAPAEDPLTDDTDFGPKMHALSLGNREFLE